VKTHVAVYILPTIQPSDDRHNHLNQMKKTCVLQVIQIQLEI